MAYIWFSLSGTPKHLHTKEDYLTTDMLQRHLQYRYIIRWLATNGKVEEGVLSEGSHSSAGFRSNKIFPLIFWLQTYVTSFYHLPRQFHPK
jgi:hypothetical protein